MRGERPAVPAGVDLAAYRIAQEALTNILKHAGRARARLVVRYEPNAVHLEIVDDGRGAAAASPARVARQRHRPRAGRACGSGRRCTTARWRPARALAAGYRVAATLRFAAARPHDPGPAGRRPGPGTGRLPRAHRERARLRRGRRGGRRRGGGGARRRAPSPTSCSWTSACPASTASRRPAASPPTAHRRRTGAGADHLRPRRVRLPGVAGRRQRVPAEGHPTHRAAERHPDRRRRRGAAGASGDPDGDRPVRPTARAGRPGGRRRAWRSSPSGSARC